MGGATSASCCRRTSTAAWTTRAELVHAARVRLCKGAYVEPEEVAFQSDEDVRRNFLKLMRILLDEGNYPAIATHDERLIEETLNHVETHALVVRGDRRVVALVEEDAHQL